MCKKDLPIKIDSFLEQQGIDEFGIISIDDLQPDFSLSGNDPLVKGYVMILIKQIPRFAFNLEIKLKSFYLFQYMRDMDRISFSLAQYLNDSGCRAVPAPTFFPARMERGQLKGMVPLKRCACLAGLGGIGLNTLFISKNLGNRVCLSAVLCDQEILSLETPAYMDLCTGCGKCIEACPNKAITPGCVEITKCLNFNYAIPALMRPITRHILKKQKFKRYAELCLNTIGWNVDMVCSECLTACPYFKK